MIDHSILFIHKIRTKGPCTNKTDGRTDPGQTAFWANGVRGEKFLGERTAIPIMAYVYWNITDPHTTNSENFIKVRESR